MRIESGSHGFRDPNEMGNRGWPENYKDPESVLVSFPGSQFPTKPTVVVGLAGINADSPMSFAVSAEDVTPTGFQLVLTFNRPFGSLTVFWIAYAA